MSTPRGSLAARLRRGTALRWLFVKLPCPAEVELAGACGLDAVILDTEHGSGDGLEHHLRAADAAGIPALVRVPGPDPALILRALDAGAAGIVVAHVSDPARARAAVEAAHYPPRGRRGLALTTRAGHYGTTPLELHLDRARDETLVVVQIEDAEALETTGEILAVDGVDAVLIGTADLSIALGHPGEPDHPRVAAAVAEIEAAARHRRVPVAGVVGSAAAAEAAHERGNQIAVLVSTLLIRDAFRAVAGHGADDDRPGAVPGPLLLLPGMLGTPELWGGVVSALPESLSLRPGRIDLDASVEEMAESVLVGAPDRFALAGHSLGAIVALAIVRRAPERVTGLALLHASALAPSPEQLRAWDELELRVQDDAFTDVADEFARANLPEHRRGDAALVARVADMARTCGPRVLLRQLAAQRTRSDARPDLGAIRCPTLILSGNADAVCPPVRQEELAGAIPGARLERLAGVGHMSPLEAPGRVAALLEDWLG